MADQRRAGLISVNVNGEVQSAKGDFTYGLGKPKREAIIGADGVHGYKETPQVAFIEGKLTDRGSLDFGALCELTDATTTVELVNGKTVVLRNGWYAADGTANTGESELDFRMEGLGADEV